MISSNKEREATMTPGERCDEIMRLIDETLEDYEASVSRSAVGASPVSVLRTITAASGELPRSA